MVIPGTDVVPMGVMIPGTDAPMQAAVARDRVGDGRRVKHLQRVVPARMPEQGAVACGVGVEHRGLPARDDRRGDHPGEEAAGAVGNEARGDDDRLVERDQGEPDAVVARRERSHLLRRRQALERGHGVVTARHFSPHLGPW